MDIRWPIFFVDRDGYMFVCRNQAWFEGHVEQIDAEEGEYKGWDYSGQSVGVGWDAKTKRPILEVHANEGKVNALLEAITRYARLLNPSEEFHPSGSDPIMLFELAEGHGRKATFASKLKRFVKKMTKNR